MAGPVREVAQHTGQFDTGQPRHVDVEEHRVDGARVQFAQCRRGVTGAAAPRRCRGARLQQVGQLVERGRLVVDREHRRAASLDAPPPARTPGPELGYPHDRPWCPLRSPFRPPDRSRCRTPRAADGPTLRQADVRGCSPSRRCGRRSASPWPARSVVGIHADAVVLDGDDAVGAASSRATISTAAPAPGPRAVPDRVLDQRLQREERHDDVEHLGRDLQARPSARCRTSARSSVR